MISVTCRFMGWEAVSPECSWVSNRLNLNPRLCNLCERFAEKYHGGVELEISILFVDVRGSTTMAEEITPEEFSKKINRFYHAATEVFYRNNGFVEKLLGDEVAGFFVPGLQAQNTRRWHWTREKRS